MGKGLIQIQPGNFSAKVLLQNLHPADWVCIAAGQSWKAMKGPSILQAPGRGEGLLQHWNLKYEFNKNLERQAGLKVLPRICSAW